MCRSLPVMACFKCKQKDFSTTSTQHATMCSVQCRRWYEDGTEDGAWCMESCLYGSGHQGDHRYPCNHTLPPLPPSRPVPQDIALHKKLSKIHRYRTACKVSIRCLSNLALLLYIAAKDWFRRTTPSNSRLVSLCYGL